MAKTKATTFDEIVTLAGDFVARQEGKWDHAEWLGFLKALQQKGIDLSEEAQRNLGQVLEATKSFYQATASVNGIEKAITSVATETVAFVKTHKGVWGHSEWEAFVKKVQQNSLRLSEENAGYLGGIVESVKTFYDISPVTASPVSAPRSEKPATLKAKSKTAPESKAPIVDKAVAEVTAAPKQVESSAPVREDDLTAIQGIGPALRRKLNEQGIHSFAQIAALSDDDIGRLEGSIIKFSGRIKRDDWIGQAQRFSKGSR